MIYFVNRPEKQAGSTYGVNEKYEQSYALVDHMISNIRPGHVYPKFTNIENQLVINQVKEAARKYMYVMSGGKIPEGLIDTFTQNGMEYRHMGSDLDSKEKLTRFLSESYTHDAIRSYMLHAKIVEYDGKLAQPNADGGSLLNYEDAIVVGRKDNGAEVEFDLKVPLGNSLSFEYVRVAFTKTKDGWKISSDLGTF